VTHTGGDRSEEQTTTSVIFTTAGSFRVDGSVHETLKRLATEEWPMFVLADSREQLVVRSAEVSAVQNHKPARRATGFQG